MTELELKVGEALAETALKQEEKRARLASASPAPIESAASQDLTLGS